MRRVGAALVAAVGAGVVLGLVGRLLMRLVTLAAGQTGEFSWLGTAGIVLIYVLAMVPGALLAAFWRARWRWLLLAAGAVLLSGPAASIASEEVGGVDGLGAGRLVLVLLSGVAVFATIAALPVVTLRVVDRLSPPRRDPAAAPVLT